MPEPKIYDPDYPRQTKLDLREYPPHPIDDRSDIIAWRNAHEVRARERQIAMERLMFLRRKINDCYRKEGVNHYKKCKHLTVEYMKLYRTKDFGMLRPKEDDEDKADEEES